MRFTKKIILSIFALLNHFKNLFRFDAIKQLPLKSRLKSYGKAVDIQLPVVIKNPYNVEIGNNVSIASFVHIWGGGSVKIGNNVLIASHVAIVSETHDYDSTNIYSTHKIAPVLIESNTWIGSHAVILPGVTIGEGAVIGAGSIVTKNVEPFSIVAGIPAKLVKKRNLK